MAVGSEDVQNGTGDCQGLKMKINDSFALTILGGLCFLSHFKLFPWRQTVGNVLINYTTFYFYFFKLYLGKTSRILVLTGPVVRDRGWPLNIRTLTSQDSQNELKRKRCIICI